jgi:hypothetical protein
MAHFRTRWTPEDGGVVLHMYFDHHHPDFEQRKKYAYEAEDILALADDFRQMTDAINALTYGYYKPEDFPKVPKEIITRKLQRRPALTR